MATPVWIESDEGARIAAYDFGGDGPPLLLAHATGFHAHVWGPVVEHLRGAFHCYAFDERGHGASPSPPNRDFDWHRFGDDARAVSATFGLDRPLVAGHSAGGALLLLAEEAHPGTWAGCWAFEPVVPDAHPAPEGQNPLAEGARRRRSRFDSLDAAYANFAAKPPFGGFDPAALHAYVDHGFVPDDDGGVTLACAPEDEAATYENALTSRAWERLNEVQIPVQVVCGEDSSHFPFEVMEAIAERLPHGSLEVLHGVGHFAPLENPALVAKSILATLA